MAPKQTTKTSRLRGLLSRPKPSFLLEAHNGLSAKIVEEAGFEGVWGSGLSISAALGVRDNNEASWSQVAEVVEFMTAATTLPILLDGDTGYGDFNSFRRLVQKLEQRDVAGVCIEDKTFPKANSFIRGDSQKLADIDEFAGKIKAGKDAQRDDDFVIVARVEAFIAGRGLSEALTRAEAYRRAGADAILIHSAKSQPDEVVAFKTEWGNRLPIMIVPTKYYATPSEVFLRHQFAIVIWANHLMRSAVSAMQQTAATIFADRSLVNVEHRIATLNEIFRIQRCDELEDAERRYLPAQVPKSTGIVVIPSDDRIVSGRSTSERIVESFRSARIQCVIPAPTNSAMNEVTALAAALPPTDTDAVVSCCTTLVKRYVIDELVDTDGDFVVAVDAHGASQMDRVDYTVCSAPAGGALDEPVTLRELVTNRRHQGIDGAWMGLLKVSAAGMGVLRSRLCGLTDERTRYMSIAALVQVLIHAGSTIRVVFATGYWVDGEKRQHV